MKTILPLILIFFFLTENSFGQDRRPTGLTFDDDKYNQTPLQPRYGGSKYNEIPLEYSLKKYCPIPGDQGDMSSCVGWASGYGLLTMSRAIQQDLTDSKQITQLANSALFIYNQIILNPQDCASGASLTEAMKLLKTQGDCLAENFDKKVSGCDEMPTRDAKGEAVFYKIKDYAALFQPSAPSALKIDKIRKSIANNKPVVVGMQLTTSFFFADEDKEVWTADEDEGADENFGHAMVVVGYDEYEKYFEIMNSFGTEEWGNKGFIKIGYDEFAKRCRYAFQIMFDDAHGKAAVPSMDTEKLLSLSGTFEFREIIGSQKDEYGNAIRDYLGNKIPKFNVVGVTRDKNKNIYVMKDSWNAGTRFQLATSQVPEGKHVYVFSIGSDNKVESHFPREKENGEIPPMATYLPSKDAELIIPTPNRALALEKGEDNLVVIFSDKTIDNYKERLDKINNKTSPIYQKVEKGFGDILLSNDSIKFENNQMQFKIKQAKKKKYAVALVLKTEGL